MKKKQVVFIFDDRTKLTKENSKLSITYFHIEKNFKKFSRILATNSSLNELFVSCMEVINKTKAFLQFSNTSHPHKTKQNVRCTTYYLLK